MKKLSLTLIFLTIGLLSAFSQTPSDSITMKKVFGGYQFYQGEYRLTMGQLVNSMESNEQAYIEISKARATYVLGSIVNGAGGAMIGYPLGTAIAGGEPNWMIAGIGVGLIVVSIPIIHKFNKQAKNAVDIFNGGLVSSSWLDKSEFRFRMTGNGLGLIFKF